MDSAQNGRMNTTNWEALYQLRDSMTFSEEAAAEINAQAKSDVGDGQITWNQLCDTVAKYFPRFIDPEKAAGWNAVLHFIIGSEKWEYTLKIEDGKSTFESGLSGDPTAVTAMDAETFISTVMYTKKYSDGSLELTDDELEGVAGGKGASACGSDHAGASASGAGACGGAVTGAGACGAQACGGAVTGAGACGADACGAAFCGLVLTGVDACAADACGIDVIPGVPGI